MSELTGLEICKKIAEIENEDTITNHDEGVVYRYITPSFGTAKVLNGEFNPLTDKALCFDLMVKHKIHSVGERPKGYYAETWSEEQSTNTGAFDKNPQKAICLAIIAKHNKE